jgi:hypothetical protein
METEMYQANMAAKERFLSCEKLTKVVNYKKSCLAFFIHFQVFFLPAKIKRKITRRHRFSYRREFPLNFSPQLLLISELPLSLRRLFFTLF